MKKLTKKTLFVVTFLIFASTCFSSGSLKEAKQVEQEIDVETKATPQVEWKDKTSEEFSEGLNNPVEELIKDKDIIKGDRTPLEELVKSAWANQHDLGKLEDVVKKCILLYGKEAKAQQKLLKNFPPRGDERIYKELNDVGVCLFVRAEAYMYRGKKNKSQALFQEIIDEYGWSQAWDPSRGSYWSVAEKSQASIDVITGEAQKKLDAERVIEPVILPSFYSRGTNSPVDYTQYGKFVNVGAENYKYSISDIEGLASVVGEGIYPNTSSVYNNPRLKIVKAEGRMKGLHWDFVNTNDLEAAYFKWATAPEPWGVKLFYIGMIFEKSQMFIEALKAYHALIVHFPKTVAWTYWQTPWYPAQAAVSKIRHIIRTHPELELEDMWMNIELKNGFDNETKNDVIMTWPGKIIKQSLVSKVKDKLRLGKKVPLENSRQIIGSGKVKLVQYENGHWQMLVDDKPFLVQAITYAPTKTGQTPDKGTLANWMTEDTNSNGAIDGPYDSWVDTNRNNKQDEDETVVGDFQLMKEMGVNAIRVYDKPDITINKKLLKDMYDNYGIRVILGNFLGKYAIGSGAAWSEGTDYDNPVHKKNMMESVKKMVLEHKDEPYVLMWLLGNENNYGVACNADEKPEAYFKFVDEVAQMIKVLDRDHPVAVNNGDTLFLDIFAKNAPNVDIFAANIYRGDYGFGAFWSQVFDATGKPAMIAEYGCPAFAGQLSYEEAEKAQADYHLGNWLDIQENTAGYSRGIGNSIGGIVFEWLDEWWKNYEPFLHDRSADAVGPFPGGFYYEEWFGLVAQGNGQKSPFLRQLRQSYFTYKKLWNDQK